VRDNDGRFPTPSEQKTVAYDNETTLLPMLDGPAATFNCEAAQKFSRPSLLLYREHTRPWYREVVTRLSKCLSNAEVSEIPKSTHFVEEDNPTETAAAILRFLSHHSGQ
jgi:pimeloyl-ACP methyl ester carboxylesterase